MLRIASAKVSSPCSSRRTWMIQSLVGIRSSLPGWDLQSAPVAEAGGRGPRVRKVRRVTWSPDRRLGVLLLAAAAGTNVPTPLLLVYRDELDLSDASLTAIFGVYALGLMLALAVAGQAADRWG